MNSLYKIVIASSVVFLMLVTVKVKASHAAGGEITYKCLGGNLYEVSGVLYINCDASSVAGIPSSMSIGIFNASGVSIQNLNLPQVSQNQITGNAPNACTEIPAGICLNIGEYRTTVNLPPIPGGYQLTYRLCARNSGIANGLSGCAAYSTWLPDVSVATCNSSAKFNDWPPVFICKDEPFTFDHGATDIDGDSLYYSLCDPLQDVNPSDPFEFFAGYSATAPLGASSTINIDPLTGLLTGMPLGEGKHVVAICVSEYRNGQLLGSITRDFQLNVVECEKTVISTGLSVLTNCVTSEVTFFNTVKGAVSYEWDFGDGSPVSNLYEPTHVYAALGSYDVQLIGFGTNPLCNDTLKALTTVVDSCRPCGMSVNLTTVDGNCGLQTPVCSNVKWVSTSCVSLVYLYGSTAGAGTCGSSLVGPSGFVPDYGFVTVGDFPNSTTIETITPVVGVCDGSIAKINITSSGGVTTVKFVANTISPQAGSANVVITGGKAPYTINWVATPPQTGVNATGLAPGNYNVVVTDANACTEVVNFTIGGDTPLSVAPTATDVSACGANDGTLAANATVINGTPIYSWNPGGWTTPTVSNVPPGTYTVTVIDNANCPATGTVTVGGVPILNITTAITDAKCADSADGIAAVTSVTGGAAISTYSWNTSPVQTTATASNLSKNFYTVTVTDINGCTGQKSLTIDAPTALNLVLTGTDASCSDVDDGEIEVVVTGGTPSPNYSYSWNTVPVQGGSKATGLKGNQEYVVTVTDGAGCQSKDSLEIAHPVVLNAEAANRSVISCAGVFDGRAKVLGTGGTGPYSYFWDCSAQTTDSVFNLPVGGCRITITDAKNCVAQDSLNIINPGVLTAAVSATNSCGGASDGTATATPTGGFGPYTYSWDCLPAQVTQAVSGLASGSNCTVTITDVGACSATANVVIGNNPQVTLDTTVTPDCDATQVGAIDLSVPTGTAPYVYNWSTGATTQDISGLMGNVNYKVTVFDANNCFDTLTTMLGMIACRPTVQITSPDTFLCLGDTAVLTAEVMGGTPGYTYAWNNGGNTSIQYVYPLADSLYEVVVTDLSGGKDTATMLVKVNGLPAVNHGAYPGICLDSTAFVLSQGMPVASPPTTMGVYTGQWVHNNVFFPDSAGVGIHRVNYTFTNNNGCTNSADVNITVNGLPTAGVGLNDTICKLENTLLAGTGAGVGGSYQWSPITGLNDATIAAPIASPLFTTNYVVTVKDVNNCMDKDTVVIAVQDTPVVNFSVPNVCKGKPTVFTNLSTPTTTTNSLWNFGNGQTSTARSPVYQYPAVGNYNVVLRETSSAGCVGTNTKNVEVGVVPVLDFIGDVLQGCPAFTTLFSITSADYDAAYTYTWNFGDGSGDVTHINSSQDFSYLYNNSGIFDVTLRVETQFNCGDTLVLPAYVDVYEEPVASFIADPQQTDINNPKIEFLSTSTGEDNWNWSFGDGGSSVLENPFHTYKDTAHYTVRLIVENSKMCRDTVYGEMFVKDVFTFFAPNTFTPNGDGLNDVFIPKFHAENSSSFSFKVYDRWGGLVYETTDTESPWNGTFMNTGKPVPTGVYVWKVNLVDVYQEGHEYLGNINITK